MEAGGRTNQETESRRQNRGAIAEEQKSVMSIADTAITNHEKLVFRAIR